MLAKLLSGGSAAARATPTFVSSSISRVTTAGNTVTAPTGIQDGDLLIAVGVNINSGLTITAPSGFNIISIDGSADNTIFIATKTASSESGNYTWTWSAAASNTVAMLVYRNATVVNTIGSVARASSATGTASSITPTYTGVLCAVFALELNAAITITTPPSGMTQRAVHLSPAGGGSNQSPSFAVYDLYGQAASATGDKAIVWDTSGVVASVLFQVTNELDIEPDFIASANTSNSGAGTSLVINKPTGTVENDLMVAVMASGSGANTWTGATDWTEVADQGADPSLRIAYKVAGASEGSSYTFTSSGSALLSGCILTYRYAAYDTIAGAFTTGANPLSLTSISPTLSQSKLIAVGARSAVSITLGTPTSMTARVTDNDANDPSYIVCDQSVAKGPTGIRSMSTGSTTAVSGIMLAIKPTRSL